MFVLLCTSFVVVEAGGTSTNRFDVDAALMTGDLENITCSRFDEIVEHML